MKKNLPSSQSLKRRPGKTVMRRKKKNKAHSYRQGARGNFYEKTHFRKANGEIKKTWGSKPKATAHTERKKKSIFKVHPQRGYKRG